jgi:hypothetical protein
MTRPRGTGLSESRCVIDINVCFVADISANTGAIPVDGETLDKSVDSI